MKTHIDEITADFQRVAVAYYTEKEPLDPGWKYIPHTYQAGNVLVQSPEGNTYSRDDYWQNFKEPIECD